MEFGTRRAGLSTSPGDAVTSGPTTYHPSERSRTTVRNTLPNTTTSCGPPPSHTATTPATQNLPITRQNPPPPTLCVGKECRHRCVCLRWTVVVVVPRWCVMPPSGHTENCCTLRLDAVTVRLRTGGAGLHMGCYVRGVLRTP